jgi:hypothetical protein
MGKLSLQNGDRALVIILLVLLQLQGSLSLKLKTNIVHLPRTNDLASISASTVTRLYVFKAQDEHIIIYHEPMIMPLSKSFSLSSINYVKQCQPNMSIFFFFSSIKPPIQPSLASPWTNHSSVAPCFLYACAPK